MSDPQPLVVTGPIIVEGILVLNVNYKQVNIPLCSDSHMPFSKVTCQGFWSELPNKTAPYLLSMEGYPYRHFLWVSLSRDQMMSPPRAWEQCESSSRS